MEKKMRINQYRRLYLPVKTVLVLAFLVSIISGAFSFAFAPENNPGEGWLTTYERLVRTAEEKGYARIIIKLNVDNIKELTEASTQYKTVTPGLKFPAAGIQADLDLENAIQTSTYSVLHRLNGVDYRLNHMYGSVPYLALQVSSEALAILPSLPEVLDIFEDRVTKIVDPPLSDPGSKPSFPSSEVDFPMLNTSTDIIGADNAWSMGYTGQGWYVAILDTGIRRTHQFFQGKTIVEACFSLEGDCPNGGMSMYGTGAAAHYESTYDGYDHGSHVGGIAAGNYGSLAGVAKKSNIIAVQVCSRFSAAVCGGSPCVASYDSDQVKGLDYVYSLRGSYSIAAVNMSLGGGAYSSYCDSEPHKASMDNLKSVRIATVVSAGNESQCSSVSSPACISSAVSVGAVDKSDNEAWFNNWHDTLLEVFAPGVSIYSATGSSNSSYGYKDGTSMAAPHVTGAWALLRQASPSSSVNTLLTTLRNTGVPISSVCSSKTIPRVQVDDAIIELTGTPPPSTSITVTSPNGGESWTVGSTHAITWTITGTVGNVKIEYTSDNGSNWSTVVSSTANDGAYSWTVPNTPSIKCKVRIKEASDGTPSDTSNSTFSIVTAGPGSPGITVTSPNGGENWQAGSTHTIKWTSTGTVGNVKIEFSSNNGSSWSTVVSAAANDGSYSWKVPDTASSSCRIKISEASDGSPSDTSNGVFTISKPTPPEISLNRTHLNFCAIQSGTTTGPQTLLLDNSGGQTLNWNVNVSGSWLTCTPLSGSNAGVLNVSVNPASLAMGSYSGTITITAANAGNSPQAVTVALTVKSASQDQLPFGDFATPFDGATVNSSIPITGWALDDVEIASVKIYRSLGSTSVLGYVGDAVLVEGARPDVESGFPTYPKNYRGGWGYMMLTNSLPDGMYVLFAIAADSAGHEVTLGSKRIVIYNAGAVKPFGAIDTPAQGGTASGSNFIVWGWVLTPQPNKIPVDGSTIDVYVDGKYLGHPVYNIYRADIASLFPGYANSSGAVGYFYLDTTAYENGVHTIQWTAVDSAGNRDGIGSRYFTIQNTAAIKKR
jgi:subtilisin family serine protease